MNKMSPSTRCCYYHLSCHLVNSALMPSEMINLGFREISNQHCKELRFVLTSIAYYYRTAIL